MAHYYEATRTVQGLKIGSAKLEKKDAMRRIRNGQDVYTNKSMAHTLSSALSDGQGNWRDGAHVPGGYPHYHDANHDYYGHIFYGQPH